MRADWVQRMQDQARTEMGYCVAAVGDQWCDAHESFKDHGAEACDMMLRFYGITESAGEVMGDLIATEIEALADDPLDWNESANVHARIARGVR